MSGRGAYYNENDKFAAQWLRNLIAAGHIAPGEVDDRSILDVRPGDLDGFGQCHFFAGIAGWSRALRIAGIADDCPVWTGSCPCQPLSSAGQHKGHVDQRHLWPSFYRLIAECGPPTVIGEQVASKDGREWFAAVRSDLEALGYAIGGADLCAAGIGAPHIRSRLWWVANADNEGWQGRERQRKPDQEIAERQASHCELMRSARGSWPQGPAEVHNIPVCSDGLPNRVERMRAYGNAIVPPLAAEFIMAAMEAKRAIERVPG